MSSNGMNHEKPLPWREQLAAMTIFLLPLFSLFALTGVSLPEWANYISLVVFWGCILFALVLAVAKGLPGWSLPYLGFILILGLVLTPLPRLMTWVYPSFLEAFGPMADWPISTRILYSGLFDFALSLTILLGALILVNLLRLLPYTRAVWERVRADWTQLSFLIYGGLVFYVMLAFDEYRQEELWKVSAWACLALGAWLYLKGKGRTQRILALLGSTTATFWIIAIANWVLIPLQKWPTGYPIAPSQATRWVSTADTLLTWLFILGILCAPALTSWLPPYPKLPSAEENDSGKAHAA